MAPRRDRVCALFTALLVLSGVLAAAPFAPAAGSQPESDICPRRGQIVAAGRLARAVERGCESQGRIVEDHGARAVVPPKGFGVYAEALTLEGTQEFSIETSSSGMVRLSDLGDDTRQESFVAVLGKTDHEALDFMGSMVVTNDTHMTPEQITEIPFAAASTTIGAASEINEPDCDGSVPYSTRWFRFDAPDPRRLHVTLFGDHPVALAVFRDEGAGVLSPVACPAVGPGITRTLLSPRAGTGYLIRVGSVSETEQGAFELQVDHAATHDAFADARGVSPLPHVSIFPSGYPVRALEADEPKPRCGDIRSTLWYRLTPSSHKTLQATVAHLNGSGAMLGVYRGTTFRNLSRVDCAGEGKPLRFRAEADKTYLFQVGVPKGVEPKGTLRLRVDGGTPPPNDAFSDATRVGSLPFARNVGIGYGTIQGGEPRPSCSEAKSTAWFRFRPSHSGYYKATATSEQDRFVAVYRGERMGSLRKDGCARKTVVFRGHRGTTYHLQLGRGTFSLGAAKLGLRETLGPIETCLSCNPPCADGASNLLNYRQEGRFAWHLNTRSIPAGLDRSRTLAAMKRGFANVTGARNDCDIPDDVSASAGFGGTTGKRATACYGGPDGVNVVDFGPLEPGPIGLACAWWRVRSGVDKLIESDVRFLPGNFWTLSPARKASDCRSEVDLESVVTHEAGHVFGLAHVEGEHRNLTMHWSPNFCTAAGRTFGLGDLRGLRSRY